MLQLTEVERRRFNPIQQRYFKLEVRHRQLGYHTISKDTRSEKFDSLGKHFFSECRVTQPRLFSGVEIL